MRHPGKWEFPGGKIEGTESERAALVRELHEELGLVVLVGERLGASYWREIELIAYACSGEGEITLTEHDALRWCTLGELSALDWADADVSLVAAVVARG